MTDDVQRPDHPRRAPRTACALALVATFVAGCASDVTPPRPARLNANLAELRGDLFMRYPDGERIEVATYRDGEIHGAARVRRAFARKLPRATTNRMIDSPQIGTWRRLAGESRAAIVNDAPPREIVSRLERIPFEGARNDLLAQFIRRSPHRADEMTTALVNAPTITPAPAIRDGLIRGIVRDEAVDDFALSHFAALPFFEETDAMVTAFATAARSGPLTAASLLVRTPPDEMPAAAFSAIAPRLAKDRAFADVLVRGLKSLEPAKRSTLARTLADRPDASRLFILRLLDELPCIAPEYRPYLYVAAAKRIMHDESLHPAILDGLQRLEIRSRADALQRVLRAAPSSLSARAASRIAALPFPSRAAALEQIIETAAFVHPPIDETQRKMVEAAARLDRAGAIRVLKRIHADKRTVATIREDVRVRLTVLQPAG